MIGTKIAIAAGLMVLISFGCKHKPDNSGVDTSVQKQGSTASLDVSGNYVNPDYASRDSGYDWIAVTVRQLSPEMILISVRSRADHKKPTCTFDTKAYRRDDTTYTTLAEGKPVVITFTARTISIATERREDEAALYFFCSGGATVAGTYEKIDNALDATQIDKTTFSKVLRLQNIGFNVSSRPKGMGEEITIYPFGLSMTNQEVKLIIEGSIVDAEVEDLNSDGSPEILVYTRSGENRKGNVLGCSVNNQKSMGLFYFPPTSENPRISKGYEGHDEFTVVETMLCQRFPIYENGQKTGKIRQVCYELVNGEAAGFFRVKSVNEY